MWEGEKGKIIPGRGNSKYKAGEERQLGVVEKLKEMWGLESRVSSKSTQDTVEGSMQDPDAEQSRKPQYGLGVCPEDNRMTLSV